MDKLETERAAAATYERIADRYAAALETKPHNAYYDRPAVISLWPNVAGLDVLDTGCGPGVYAEELVNRGARVTAGDISARMCELASVRLAGRATVTPLDLAANLPAAEAAFDMINAPLCLDYVRDWRHVFSEFFRVLRPGGIVIMSAAHPDFDAEYFKTDAYFDVESVEATWSGFGEPFRMNCYRRSLADFINPPLEAGFRLDRLLEPLPTEQFRQADPRRHERLMRRPSFLMMRLQRP
ncbi:MAG: class I SAM-dependent methyltransferase [Hyphomonadaceae bacterium]|nr:class I SAM-dependent methyltransferase [Hyphomonadaceae bacterium]